MRTQGKTVYDAIFIIAEWFRFCVLPKTSSILAQVQGGFETVACLVKLVECWTAMHDVGGLS